MKAEDVVLDFGDLVSRKLEFLPLCEKAISACEDFWCLIMEASFSKRHIPGALHKLDYLCPLPLLQPGSMPRHPATHLQALPTGTHLR